jgi:hypothetical protein
MKRFLILIFTCLIIAGFVMFLPGTAKASGAPSNALFGVATVARDDSWAVGESTTSTGSRTLIEHLDDNAWQVVSSPSPSGATFAVLSSVAVVSEHNVWAVGSFTPSSNFGQTLIEHWNGQVWQVIANPNPVNAFLNSVTAVSHKDVWVVGFAGGLKGASTTLIEHWNGQVWQIIPSPNPAGSSSSVMYGVIAHSHKDVWAVGSSFGNGSTTTLAEHWNGQSWSIVFSPTP